MIEKLDSAVFSVEYIISSYLGPNSIIFDNINLDDEYLDYCDLETINHVRLDILIVLDWVGKKQKKIYRLCLETDFCF